MPDQMSDYLLSQMNAQPINLNTSIPAQTSDATSAPPSAAVDASGKAVDPSAAHEVSSITVSAPKAPLKYDNRDDQAALMKAENNIHPPGGGDNPGLFGLIPGMSHGTLRNVLGAVGDAFLMHAGQQPWYEQRLQRQKEGLAMAGYANNPQAAIERVAGTGTPGSMGIAANLEENYQNAQARKAQLAMTQGWHEDTLEQRRVYEQQQIDARNQANIQKLIPYAGTLAQGATDKPSYEKAYAQAESMAQRVDPKYHAYDLGLPAVEDWQPGLTKHAGMTSNQVTQTNDRQAERVQQGLDTQTMADARKSVARMIINRRGPNDNEESAILAEKLENGTASDEDIQRFDRINAIPRGARRPIHNNTGPSGGRAPPNRGGGIALPPDAVTRYNNGTPQQKAAARASWAKAGYNLNGLN